MIAFDRATRLAKWVARAQSPAPLSYLQKARVRLTIFYVGILCILLAIIGIAVYLVLGRVLSHEIDSDLRAVAASVANRDALLQTDQQQSTFGNPYTDVFVFYLDQHGILTYNANLPIEGLPDSGGVVAAQTGQPDLRTVTKSRQRLRLYTQLVRRSDGQVVGTVQTGKSLRPNELELHDIALVLAGGGVVALWLAAIGGMMVAHRALRPVQQSWQRQQAFVADASHELRTPLAIVRADAEVLLRSLRQTIEQNRELVEDIIGETDHLTGMVADMLTLTRLDAGRLPLERAEFDARELLDDVAAQTRRVLDGRSMTLAVEAPASLPVYADRERLLQVLRILIDNAQRHTPDGGQITLAGRSERGHVVLEVRDTGSGIPPEHLGHIFERFYRADTARTRTGGAGIGLAIARGIIEAHAGRLRAASVVGFGTTITIALPLPPAVF